MPVIRTAKQIAEDALSTIGAFPASMSAPDAGELKKTLNWLEMLLNYQTGIRPLAGFWQVFEIPLEAGIGDYDLSDYAEERGVCHVFSASLVNFAGDPYPLEFIYESNAVYENLSDTGCPTRATVTKDADMVLKLYPTPTIVEEQTGLKVRVRVQTYNESIDPSGVADEDIRLRPSWYLWLVKRLAYEIGSGPVRRISESELARIEKDMEKLENALLARDGQYGSPRPPITDPVEGSVDTDCYRRRGYRPVGERY